MCEKVLSTVLVRAICLVSILVILLDLFLPYSIFAYDSEVVLSEVYQTTREQEALKEKFMLDFSLGMGYNNAQPMTGSFYDLDIRTQIYLRALDLNYSENYGTLRLTATYAFTEKAGIYIAIPYGAVKFKKEESSMARIFEEDTIKGDVGDIYGGIYYNLLSGSKSTPNISLNLDANSDTAKYWSLGDGLWDFTGGVQIRQLLFDSFFVYGLGDYTYRLKKNDIEPGAVIGYGGGIGFIFSDNSLTELGLRASKFDKATRDHGTLLDESDDLTFVWLTKYGRVGFAFTMGNLNNAVNFKQNTVGLELLFPIY